jgi:hypothetical protein
MSKQKKTVEKVRAVIDCTSGTVLGPDNLWFVVATEKQMCAASQSDSDAFDLAHEKGKLLDAELLQALYDRDIVTIARAMGCSVEQDNTGQIVLYTGLSESE